MNTDTDTRSLPTYHRDRAITYRSLAAVFRRPEAGCHPRLGHELAELGSALSRLGTPAGLQDTLVALRTAIDDLGDRLLGVEWDRTFEPSGGLACSPHETSHTARNSQEAWLKTYRLADIAGFYRAFGVEVTPETETVDHIGVELEFMHLLAVKAALAFEHGSEDDLKVCRDAEAAFLDDHLGLWCDRLAAALRSTEVAPTYAIAATLLRDFVAWHRTATPVEPR